MGAFAYADDLILLAPTKQAMDKMLIECETFSKEYDIAFNPSKSKLVFFGEENCTVTFKLQGITINKVPSEKHLGIIIGKYSQHGNIQNCISQLYGHVNLLLSQFSKVCLDLKFRLFKSFCMATYGCQL